MLDSLDARVAQLGKIEKLDAKNVRFVDVSALLDSTSGPQFDTIVTKQSELIGRVRAAVEASTTISPLLASASIKSDQIVGLDVDDKGNVWLLYRK